MSGSSNDLIRPPAGGTTRKGTGFPASVILLWCFLWPLFPACSRQSDANPGQILRLSQRNEPATLDPQLATLPDEFFIIRALSEGLVSPSPDGGPPLPALAEKWRQTADGLTYYFDLRPGLKWSNGDPVTADDVAYSIQRALTPRLAAPKAALFFSLKNARAYYQGSVTDFSAVGVRAAGRGHLVFTLQEPTADFLAMVASGPWIPVHRSTVERYGADWTRPGNFVGNGPFVLTAWRPNQEVVVAQNAGYWDSGHVGLREIRFLAFDNGDTEERAFRAGQVDVTMSVPFSKLSTYRAARPPVWRSVPLHETRYLALNTTRPPLNDRRVRRALSLAINRKELVEKVLRGGQRPAFSFIPPGLGGYVPETLISEDTGEARRLLAEAGFPEGRGFPRLDLTTWVNTPVLEAIQQTWHRKLGIDVAIVQHEARTHLAALVAGDYAIAMVTAIPDYDGASDLFTSLTSRDPGNYPHWSDAEFDRLVADSGRLGSAAARSAARHRAEKELLEAMPLIPLYFNSMNFLLQPAVQGWRADALWTRFYKNVHLHEK